MLRSLAALTMLCSGNAWVRAAARPASQRSGFLDGLKSGLAEMTKTATVRHVLVPSRLMALKLQKEAEKEGVTPEVISRLAQQYSTCGSAKKTPDAAMRMLRGAPGELTFKRGEMAKAFETAAFAAPVGSLSVVETSNGWHLIYVTARSDEAAPINDAAPINACIDEAAPPRRGKTAKKQKGFGVRGGFVAPPVRPRSTHLAASKLPPLVEKLQFLVPLSFVAQISFLFASKMISGDEALAEYGRLGTEYLKTNTDFAGPRSEIMKVQGEAQQIWLNNVLRDLEAGGPVTPPLKTPYPKYELFTGRS